MEINEIKLFNFEGKYKPAKYPPKEDGFYMTIRCGLEGIYTHLDEWKNNTWQVRILDDSHVIAYSREQISKEQVDNWCKLKLEKYRKEKENL